MSTPHTGILLINLGTPRSPRVRDVKRYLREFLSDYRVVDINPIARFFLVNGIIVPFRGRKSAAAYKKIWTTDGSPLMVNSRKMANNLQKVLPQGYIVRLAMRYQQPSIENALDELKNMMLRKIIIMPLFPQYTSSTTGSVHDKIMTHVRWWSAIPEIHFISQYPTHPLFIKAWCQRIKEYDLRTFDKIIFSYHGLPVRQLQAMHRHGNCSEHDCQYQWTDNNRLCYKASCFATTRAIQHALGLNSEMCEVVFQSRLGGAAWIEPYASERIQKLPSEGCRKILICSPSFTADCLETLLEIGEEYHELFIQSGGEKLEWVRSLNDSETWAACLSQLAQMQEA